MNRRAGPRGASGAAFPRAARVLAPLLVAAGLITPAGAPPGAYPLDGEAESGIRRLQGYRLDQETPRAPRLSPGQLWGIDDITLGLLGYDGPDFDALPEDPALAAFLADNLRGRDPSYAMVLVDIADPADIRWAGLRPDLRQNPGSVGKLLCMAALFHALAETWPDPEDRARILRETHPVAGRWVTRESHKVPKWDAEARVNRFSVIVPEDRFALSEWLDHAISASANGAGAIVWREAMLVSRFGTDYATLGDAARDAFFRDTPKSDLAALAQAVVRAPLEAAAIDTSNLQQGSSFTSAGKQIVPGTVSFATPRELARFAFRLEQGRLVDEWSSREMKRYMYLTKRRYRYAYAPELADAAVFFKSGSLYQCRAEEGFRCGKYMGNVRNLMNSLAIVESRGEPSSHYIAALMSNVLRFNSAWDHSRIGAAVHETMRTRKVTALREQASEAEMREAGKSD